MHTQFLGADDMNIYIGVQEYYVYIWQKVEWYEFKKY